MWPNTFEGIEYLVKLLVQTEHPLPVQYIHVYKDGQIVTTPMDHSGG